MKSWYIPHLVMFTLWVFLLSLFQRKFVSQDHTSSNNVHLTINSLWPSDVIWRNRSGSTLVQIMACCLTAPSHYLNQCWLFVSELQATSRWQAIIWTNLWSHLASPGHNELNVRIIEIFQHVFASCHMPSFTVSAEDLVIFTLHLCDTFWWHFQIFLRFINVVVETVFCCFVLLSPGFITLLYHWIHIDGLTHCPLGNLNEILGT